MLRFTFATVAFASMFAISCASQSSTVSPKAEARLADETLLDPQADAPGLRVGEQAPTLTLMSADGRQINRAEAYRQGPVIVTFYRGGWCPYCVEALKDWGGKTDELEAAGATFIAISPETREHALETTETVEGDWLALVDTDGSAMRAFKTGFALDPQTESRYRGYGIDLDTWNTNGEWELPAPATYVIDRDGVVRWAYADWDYKKRADPDEVIAAAASLGG